MLNPRRLRRVVEANTTQKSARRPLTLRSPASVPMFRCASPFARSFRPVFKSPSAKRSIGTLPSTGKAASPGDLPFPTLFARSALPLPWRALRSRSSRADLRADIGQLSFQTRRLVRAATGHAPVTTLTKMAA